MAVLLATTAACGRGERPGTAAADHDGPAPEYEANALVLADEAHGPELCLGPILTSDPPQCGGPPIPNWDWQAVPWRERKGRTTMAEAYVRGAYDGKEFTLTAPPERPRPTQRDTPKEHDFSAACDEPEVIDPAHGMAEYEEGTQRWGHIPDQVAGWVSYEGRGKRDFVANIVVRPGRGDEARRIVRAHYQGRLCLVERDQPTISELSTVQHRVTELLKGQVLSASSDNIGGVVEVTVIAVTDDIRRRVEAEFGDLVVLDGRLRPVR